ncbi:MAG: hypothetical protein OEL77_02905 [Nitrosopumilus sp.]|nr:hypothetical protein [Nitrosopumilus sp.]
MSLNSVFLRCFVDTYPVPYDDTHRILPKPNDSIHLVLHYNKKQDFGTCIIFVNQIVSKTVLFYTENTKKSCIKELKQKYDVISRLEFVEKIFIPYVQKARAKCIGFGLPFILSRLASDVTYSTRHPNGFSFTMSDKPKIPDMVIKSLDSKSQFIEFNKTFRKKFKDNIPYYRGCFVDCKTLGFVLTNNSYDLKTALTDFDVPIPDESPEGHALAVYSLYNKQMARYKIFCLDKLENKLFSPASIGIGDLEKIGIKPFLIQNKRFSKKLLGNVMSTYYGALVEAQIINTPTLVTILDFASMFPTLFVLFGMYQLLIAQEIGHKDTTRETQKFLDKITISEINKPKMWPKMLSICKIIPDDDILPVRSDYSDAIFNVGMNYLKSTDDTALYYTLPDLIASKLRTGKTPQIIEAVTFFPQGVQKGLRDFEVLPGITCHKGEDLFQKLIEQRFAIQKQKQTKESQQIQKILKIIANSTCYGKFIQLDTRNTIKEKQITVYGLDTFDTTTCKIENPTKFFHPIISVFLTAGSRLILAAAEHLLEKNGGSLMYCDTDSAFVSPEHTKLIQDFFRPLNPYSEDVEMFKIQKEDGKELKNVMCLAISSKRYVVFDKVDDEITILKYSNHALGHYLGIDHKQFWNDIISLWYHPEKEDSITSKYETKYAISELSITHYSFLKSFDGVNQGKKYHDGVRPYDTVLVGTAFRTDSDGRPIVPFVPKIGSNFDEIPFMPFVDKSGILYPNSDSYDTVDYWKKISKVFSEYRKHRESKLDFVDNIAMRKHLVFGNESVRYVGKEVHDLESSKVFGISDSVTYENEQGKLSRIIEELTLEKSESLGIPRRTYYDWKKKVKEGKTIVLKDKLMSKILP